MESQNFAASYQSATFLSHSPHSSLEQSAVSSTTNGTDLFASANNATLSRAAAEVHTSSGAMLANENVSPLGSKHREASMRMVKSLQMCLFEKDQCIQQLMSENATCEAKQKSALSAAPAIENLTKVLHERENEIDELKTKLSESEIEIRRLKVQTVNAVNLSQKQFQDKTSSSSHENLPQLETALMSNLQLGDQTQTNDQALDGTSSEQATSSDDRIKAMEFEIKKMQDMNLQWQRYDQQREEFVKLMNKEIEQLKQENEKLKTTCGTSLAAKASSSQSSLEFTPAQQNYMEKVYQKLRSEADQLKEQLVVVAEEAERNLQTEKTLRMSAERLVSDLQTKLAEQEDVVKRTSAQCEELQAALVVATRSHQYSSMSRERPSEDQSGIINNLREAVSLMCAAVYLFINFYLCIPIVTSMIQARQYESDYRKLEAEYRAAQQKITFLQRQLNPVSGA